MHKTTPPTKFLFTLLFFFLGFIGFSQTSPQTYSTSGTSTFTVPAGVTSITFQSWGAGGGGSNRNGAAAGGGGGAFAGGTITGLTAGDILTIFVGAGGTAGVTGQNTTITINTTPTITANGGASSTGRTGGNGGAASTIAGFITSSFAGGNGGNARGSNNGGGDNEGGGGGGGSATTLANGVNGGNGGNTQGGTAGTGYGTGGVGGAADGSPDAGAGGIGAGGGGRGEAGGSSKSGGNGQVILSWVVVPCTTYILSSTAASSAICAGTTATINLTGLAANLPTGTYTVTYDLGAPNAATGLTASMTVSTAGTGSFTTATIANSGPTGITITNLTKSGCSSSISVLNTATITVNSLPTANAGSALTAICQGGTTAALGGSFGGAATSATWSTTAGGTFANNTGNSPGAATWTPPASFTGTATLVLTTTGGSCTAATASKTQVVNANPTITIGTALTAICQGGTTAALGGTYGGGATSATWSTGSGGSFANNTGSTPGTATWTPPAGFTGTATLVLTTAGGSCGTVTDSKTQIVNLAPTANAGSALTAICQGETSEGLGGSFGGAATSATWSTTSGGTFANNTGNSPGTATWTPPAGFTGTATLVLTTAGGSCTAATASKTQVIQEPTANAGSVLAAICQGGTTAALGGLFGGSATGATWSTTSGGTFNNNGGSTPNTATWTPPAGFTGTATLVLTTTGGSCGTTTASKTQEVNIPPTTATVGSNQSVIGLVSNALGGNTPITGTGTWSRTSGPGSVSFSAINAGSSTATVTAYGTQVLRWTITNAPCTASFAEITVVYTAPPAPEINVKGGTNTISDGDNSPSTSDFTDIGSTAIGVGKTSTFTIENTGPGPLAVGAITFTGANSTDFSVSIAPNATVASASSTTFTVTFTPSGTGTRDAVINIANDDSDENPYNFSIRGNGDTTLTKGPGGVITPLQLWLRADLLNGTTSIADNTAVSTWNTQAKGSNAIKPAAVGAPVYKNNATANINFNAVVDFTNNYTTSPQVYTDNDPNRQYLKGASGFYSRDIFAVVLPDATMTSATASNDIFCGDRNSSTNETDGTGIGYGAYTNRFTNEVLTYAVGTTNGPGNGYGVAQIGTNISYSTAGIINASNNAAGNGTNLSFNANALTTSVSDSGSFATVTNSQYWIGRSEGWDGSLDGRVAEIITLDTRATDAQRSNIQSYLAIKYGITLGVNGTSINYTNSDGNTIWNRNTGITANDVFNFDIAGIGRDDISKLNQKQSKSINTTDDITIGLTDIYTTNTANPNTFDTDKKFLVWGNNHGTLAAQPAVIVNISSGITSPSTLVSEVSFISVGRTWKIVETGGNIPTTKVSIPTTMLSATLTPPGDYLMFISSTPNFDPTAEYRVMKANGANLETTYDFDGTKYITFGFAPEKTFERCIKFDGTDDYLDAGKVLNLNTAFTVSAWVNRNSTDKTILSKRNSGFSEGYDLGINAAGKAEMSWMVGSTKHTITSSAVIPVGTWHHIGVIYNGTTAKMYIDGITNVSASMPNVPSTTQSFLIAAADGVNPTALFNGSIDEVRVWDVALSEAQFRYVINQEIQKNGTLTNGSIIPGIITLNDISSIQWNKLSAYYPMSTYTYTNAKDISDNNFTAALRNLTTVDRQTAPLPYESAADGLWQTATSWMNNTVQDLPYSKSIEDASKTIDWNIVKITHNITSQGDKTVLGLYVGVVTGSKLTATTTSGLQTDGSKIEVTHYLKLDGTIDLVGRSQLVQTEGSDLDTSSAGSIKRDQQGQANKFNYNYWSSPVGPVNNASNNNPYTVDSILRDGTNPSSPGPITWIGGYDGALSPFSLARYWIYKFDNLGNAYANWTAINETGLLDPGKGFTLKGAGVSGTQNLTFIGKPNNGTISNTVGSKQLLLTGNPYASAIDANQFITDNSSSITGTLYFWEHYQTNNSHNLAEYQGGYAVKNFSGSVGPSSLGVKFISGTGTSLKNAPNQYIPVGQGFFVVGKDNGVGAQSSVTFRNSQRAFVKEHNPTGSQSLYRIPAKPKESAHWTSSNEEPVEKDTYKRIRLGFNNYNQIFHRQVVLAFMEDKANSEFNDGYDAKNIDNVVNDMYLVNGTNKLIIEGEGYFNKEASYPIGVKNNTEGTVSFIIDGLENFDENQVVFLYDDETKTYHDIRTEPYEVVLPRGENKTRFSLRFTDKTLGIGEEEVTSNEIKVAYAQNSKVLTINNTILDTPVEKVTLYNINGQSTGTWEVDNQDQQNIQLTIKGYSAGVYIAKIKTSKGVVNKKIIIP
ncbi:LamG-like jellyroll fold domain-containing protein [Flavobacterium lacustre]|uniref:LamG-like jellyroll fold domain-containing protein n=1 Tax=Flavobacterium lacustre TaxID=3016339 RepID=UPI0022B6D9A1|nr:LamG-like jellyroll fold domain-containing protein [Flavobacterium lacustre]